MDRTVRGLKPGPRNDSVDPVSIPPLPSSLIQLLWFVRIVEAGSFSEAGRRSNTSTSAMSKAVSRLEQAYGVRLLNRTTHSLSTTPEGDRLLAVGLKLLTDLEEAQEAFTEIGNQGALGRVRVSAPASFARRCIMPKLPDFIDANPGISIELEFANDFLNLAERGIDIAIGAGDVSGLPGHFVRQLCTFPWIACAARSYVETHGMPLTPAELRSHDLVGLRHRDSGRIDGWRFRNPDDGTASIHQPYARHVFDDPEAAWEMIRAGVGVGYAPAWVGLADWKNGSVVEILPEWRSSEVPLYAIRLQRRLTPARVLAVQDFIVELTREAYDGFAGFSRRH
ncbi:LysR family transcriptional regulator [Sphingomonas sp. BK235]|uniref:LysR family transcriptional regulator n=1 Tax=Sphingomonas sp. BK235 TaxID=2512131 RepID=UPI0010E8DE85|nr:LysR family transcriptional regulator [Sphingomonas sp. BK235]TCP30127.1 DNA-binding transcriptional LysR family regulator [Sphingomonas sp. BK235]